MARNGGRIAGGQSVRGAGGAEEAQVSDRSAVGMVPAEMNRRLEQYHGCAEVPRLPVPPWHAPRPRRPERQAVVDRPDHGRDPPAPPRDRRRLLPRQAGGRPEDEDRRRRVSTTYARIAGTGSYLPEKVLTNAD